LIKIKDPAKSELSAAASIYENKNIVRWKSNGSNIEQRLFEKNEDQLNDSREQRATFCLNVNKINHDQA